jgi:hypothetical protein
MCSCDFDECAHGGKWDVAPFFLDGRGGEIPFEPLSYDADGRRREGHVKRETANWFSSESQPTFHVKSQSTAFQMRIFYNEIFYYTQSKLEIKKL